MEPILSVQDVSKTYDNGFSALKNVSLQINRGEILALLGPNGAGKTTLISAITGIIHASSGKIFVDGFDNVKNYREARSRIGLVPQELTLGTFDTVYATTSFSRGLFGKKKDPAYIEKILKSLSLWDKKDNQIRMLSGGMKRRVLIAKALAHEPKVLFLDEPTAGVDVELRKEMWSLVEELRATGVTIILTTHYIEEAEEIADRVAVISSGEILLVDSKTALMDELGKKELRVQLREPISQVPDQLASFNLELADDGQELVYTYKTNEESTGITALLQSINAAGLSLKDLQTTQSSLEDIFVDLMNSANQEAQGGGQ